MQFIELGTYAGPQEKEKHDCCQTLMKGCPATSAGDEALEVNIARDTTYINPYPSDLKMCSNMIRHMQLCATVG